MLAWLEEIFESNADKARLIAILISALVAIIVLLLNQHFTSRRSRKDLLIKKIEEIYSVAIEYEAKAEALLSAINKGRQISKWKLLFGQRHIRPSKWSCDATCDCNPIATCCLMLDLFNIAE